MTLSSIEDKVGRVVYHYGSPRVIGVVTSVNEGLNTADVYWFKSKKTEVRNIYSLQDYEALVLETERKAKNHRKALNEAKKAIYGK